MRKLVIAIDLDDVVHDTVGDIVSYYNKTHGTILEIADYYSFDRLEAWGSTDPEVVARQINAYLHTADYMQSGPHPETAEILKRLHEKYSLVIVTGRPDFVVEPTKKWLQVHLSGVFTDVIHTSFYKQFNGGKSLRKIDVCKDIQAKILIDDHAGHIAEVAAGGIDGILFGDYPWSHIEKLPNNVTRAASWHEIGEILL